MYQNFMFDLYGTIVDIHTDETNPYLWKKLSCYMRLQGADYTAEELEDAYQQALQQASELILEQKLSKTTTQNPHPITLSDIEPNLNDVIQNIYAAKGISVSSSQIADWALFMRSISLEYICLFDGAKDMLKELKKQRKNVYLLSNAQRHFTEPEMRMLGIYDLFDDIFYSSDIGYKKPSWHFYNSLIAGHNLTPSDTVMVGNDWLSDAWGAADYGIDSIYVHTKQSSKITGSLPQSCKQIEDISEVTLFSKKHFTKD